MEPPHERPHRPAGAGAVTTPFDLSGRLAVVTGARRGIGLAIAEALAAAGADIIGVSARLEPAGSEVERLVRATGRRFTALSADFADRAAVHRLADELNARGPIDILVNNAGTIARRPAAEHPDELWDHVIQVNLSSQFVLSRAIGREMVRRGHGKIIFTASLLSFQGGINVPGYTASKSAIAGLTKALANEWAPHGVNVNAIVPGVMRMPCNAALLETARGRELLARTPMQRLGEPEELVGVAVYLASDASTFVTGQVLTVDGGFLASGMNTS
jgi:2-deoxy-D-gluconate 3-dehydrogenase